MIFGKQAHKSSTLAARIIVLGEEIAAGAAALADLKSRWRATIVDGDDAARAVIEDAVTTAERKAALQAERRDILIAEQEAALEQDAREEFGRRHAAQAEKNVKVAAASQKTFRRAWELLAPALRDLAEARAETDLLNRSAPDGFASLVHADDVARTRPALPRVVLSDQTVELWCFADTKNRISDQDAVRGNLLLNGPYAPAQRCVKRKFRHVRFHPSQNALYALPIMTELRFPRWDGAGVAFDGSIVLPETVSSVLRTLEADQKSKSTRPIEEEFIAADDAASDAA